MVIPFLLVFYTVLPISDRYSKYLSEIGSVYNLLANMGSVVDNGMQIANVLMSVSPVESFSGQLTAVKKMYREKETSEYFLAHLIVKKKVSKVCVEDRGRGMMVHSMW